MHIDSLDYQKSFRILTDDAIRCLIVLSTGCRQVLKDKVRAKYTSEKPRENAA